MKTSVWLHHVSTCNMNIGVTIPVRLYHGYTCLSVQLNVEVSTILYKYFCMRFFIEEQQLLLELDVYIIKRAVIKR